MPKLFLRLVIASLLAMTVVLPAAAEQRIWVALAEEGGPHEEAARELQAALGQGREVTVARWDAFRDPQAKPPDLLVTIGVAALDGMLDTLAGRKEGWAKVPMLSLLVPRDVFEARRAAPAALLRPFSAVWIDLPAERYLALIRHALPARMRIGVVAGRQTMAQAGALQRTAEAYKLKLTLSAEVGEARELPAALRDVLESSEIILALPDPDVYFKQSIPHILLTAYRARVPLVAYSAAFVRSGAMLGLYASPAQMAAQAVEMIRAWQGGKGLPAPQAAHEVTVDINDKVARSLGFTLGEPDALARELRRQKGAP